MVIQPGTLSILAPTTPADPERFQVVRGNIFLSGADILVNPVNCVGVMGAGLAREFRYRFPAMFEPYAKACRDGWLRPGGVHIWTAEPGAVAKYVVNLPTKAHWKHASRLVDIQHSLNTWSQWVHSQIEAPEARGANSIAIPALGCGLGGLAWSAVLPEIERFASHVLQNNPTLSRILVYAPDA